MMRSKNCGDFGKLMSPVEHVHLNNFSRKRRWGTVQATITASSWLISSAIVYLGRIKSLRQILAYLPLIELERWLTWKFSCNVFLWQLSWRLSRMNLTQETAATGLNPSIVYWADLDQLRLTGSFLWPEKRMNGWNEWMVLLLGDFNEGNQPKWLNGSSGTSLVLKDSRSKSKSYFWNSPRGLEPETFELINWMGLGREQRSNKS